MRLLRRAGGRGRPLRRAGPGPVHGSRADGAGRLSPTLPETIAPAHDAGAIEAVSGLFRVYAASLTVDLAYQNFSAELAGLPGAYAPPRGALLLARAADGAAVGCVALKPLAEGACEMKRLYVALAGRRTGLGRRLVEAVMAEGRRLGYREIRLDTLPSMTGAIALYRALGFAPAAPYYDTPVPGTLFLARSLDRS